MNVAMELALALDDLMMDVSWVSKNDDPALEGAEEFDPRAYVAERAEWKFVVVSFSIADQGFPKGARGYDGTAVRSDGLIIIRLPLEMSEKFFKRAEEYVRGVN